MNIYVNTKPIVDEEPRKAQADDLKARAKKLLDAGFISQEQISDCWNLGKLRRLVEQVEFYSEQDAQAHDHAEDLANNRPM